MKTWKLVSGILSIIFFTVVSFQSCAVGVSNALKSDSDIGGAIGIFLGIFLLTGGIVSIAVRKNSGNGGNISVMVLYGIAALAGFSVAKDTSFSDLSIWACWCSLCSLMGLIAIFTNRRASHNS